MNALCGGIEAGGTKFVCAVGTGPDDVRAVTRIPTTTPEETLGRVRAFFEQQPEPLAALGIGSFGPVDVRRGSPTFGFITSTPKAGWADTDVAGPLGEALGVPVAFDTDVNAAAVGEARWGAAQGGDPAVYLTVGTGIGGGALVRGRPLHGLLHPEMGHMRVPRAPGDASFAGSCPFHGDCLEGLASGPALAARWGVAGADLPPDHPAWPIEAYYIASCVVNLILTLSPQRVVLGGGVMQQAHLLPRVRQAVADLLAGYVQAEAVLKGLDTYLVGPALEGRAGILGAIALAQDLAAEMTHN